MPATTHARASKIVRRLHVARQAAEAAGQVLLRYYGRLEGFEAKANELDLVTIADQESETLVAKLLQASFPTDLILQEESDGRDGAATRQSAIQTAEFAWCVDPLDGTTNFVHGYPAFCVSIGLLHHGLPALGVVHAPARKETFIGGLGVPATLNVHPIHVSRTAALERSLVATGFPYNRRQRLDFLLPRLGRVLSHAHGVRRAGSAALDLCDVACGRLDAFYESSLSPWDLAAGHAIVSAAGGNMSNEAGGPHDVFAGETVASNGLVHDALRALLNADSD